MDIMPTQDTSELGAPSEGPAPKKYYSEKVLCCPGNKPQELQKPAQFHSNFRFIFRSAPVRGGSVSFVQTAENTASKKYYAAEDGKQLVQI